MVVLVDLHPLATFKWVEMEVLIHVTLNIAFSIKYEWKIKKMFFFKPRRIKMNFGLRIQNFRNKGYFFFKSQNLYYRWRRVYNKAHWKLTVWKKK